jgi:hypothetical protein
VSTFPLIAVTGAIRAESGDDVVTSDVATVNDVIHTGQTTFRFRPQQAVGVGDDADPERHRSRRLVKRMRVYRPRRMGIASTRANKSSADSGLSEETAV